MFKQLLNTLKGVLNKPQPLEIDDPEFPKEEEESMNNYIINDVKYLSQRDNKYIDPKSKTNVASVSCFPTSLAMVIDYCLTQLGLNKEAIGCSEKTQIEDYINRLLDDKQTTIWMKKNTSILGSWIWKYKKRTIYAVEVYIFNRLMKPLGFEAKALYNLKYDTVCHLLEQNKLPMVIGGNFKSISNVGGHMNTLVGYNAVGLKEFIVNDPYGNAFTKYSSSNGAYMNYPSKFYRRKNNKIFCISIKKI